MRKINLFILLCLPIQLLAQTPACPQDEAFLQFLEFDDLFIGEMHGTVEVPQFVQCLVEKAIEESDEKVIVSLEMRSTAREPNSEFWQIKIMEDGRSSQAMFDLVRFLVQKENQGQLNLHFMRGPRFFDSPEQSRPFLENKAKATGLELRELSQQGFLIVLAGNFHSRKILPSGTQNYLDTEGMWVGPSFTHINISSAFGGETWACMTGCGVQHLPVSSIPDSAPGVLLPDASMGHDYIYFLDIEAFTASEPRANNPPI